jgi:hypothetical protein
MKMNDEMMYEKLKKEIEIINYGIYLVFQITNSSIFITITLFF